MQIRYTRTIIAAAATLLTLINIWAAGIIDPADGTITASQSYAAGSSFASWAFDDDYETRWLAYMNPDDADNPFIGFQFTDGSSYAVKSYRVCSLSALPNRAPKDFSLQGSSNGTDWTILDEQTNQTNWFNQSTRTYTFENNTTYSYFQLVITNNNGDGTFIGLNELELFEESTPPTSIAYESFEDLTAGTLDGQGGSSNGWTASWGALSQVSVTNFSMSYEGGKVKIYGGTKAMCISNVDDFNTITREFPEQAGDVVYISALVRSKNTGTNKMLAFCLQNAESDENKYSSGFDYGYSPNYISAEVQGSSSRTRTSTGVVADDDTTFFIVSRVSRNSDIDGYYAQSDVIVNPTTLTEPETGWTTAVYTATSLNLINRVNGRTYSMAEGQEFYMDEIRVGLTYEAVVPAPDGSTGTIFIIK